MENQVKTNTDQKEQQLKKLSKMSLIRSLLPIAGLIIIFLLFNVLTNFRMIGEPSARFVTGICDHDRSDRRILSS